jgi:hypothetical protein
MSDWPAWAQIAVWLGGGFILPYAAVMAASRMPLDGDMAKAGSLALPLGLVALGWWLRLEMTGDPAGTAWSFLKVGLILIGFGLAFFLRWITTLEFAQDRRLAEALGLEHVKSFPDELYAGELLGAPVRATYFPGDRQNAASWACAFERAAAPGAVFRARRALPTRLGRRLAAALDTAAPAMTLPLEDLGRGLSLRSSPPGWEGFEVFGDSPESVACLSRLDPALFPDSFDSLDAHDGRLTIGFTTAFLDRDELLRLARIAADTAARLA